MTADLKRLVSEVLERGYVMSLATSDSGGLWVADVVYVHDEELNIFWKSDTDVRHSLAISKDPKVAGSITANSSGEKNLAIQFSGTARKIDGSHPDLAKKRCIKGNKPVPGEGKDTLNGKESWYMLKPDIIDIPYKTRMKYKLTLNQ